MKNYKNSILFGYVVGGVVPTIGYFFCIRYYTILSRKELMSLFTSPKPWMIFVLIYYILLIIFLNQRLKLISEYQKNPRFEDLEKVQKTIAFLPKFYLIQVMIYATFGASFATLPESFVDNIEYVLALLLAFAWPCLCTIPFFSHTTMLIEKWTSNIPLSNRYKFLSVKTKLFINTFVTTFGIIVVLSVLNFSLIYRMKAFNHVNMKLVYETLFSKNIVIGTICLTISFLNFFMTSKQLVSPIKNEVV